MDTGVIMKTINLPGTSLKVSRLAFGTSTLHHCLSSRDRQRLLHKAIDSGITHFDTASMYGDGIAEHELGKLPKQIRLNLTISSKVGYSIHPLFQQVPSLVYANKLVKNVRRRFPFSRAPIPKEPDFSKENIVNSFFRSLNALCLERLDCLFLHDASLRDTDEIARAAEWLISLKERGLVRHVGLSGDPVKSVEVRSRFPDLFDLLQVEDNITGDGTAILRRNNLVPQFTFGYFRQARAENTSLPAREIMSRAFRSNPHGVVVVSTRRESRLVDLTSLAEECEPSDAY